MFKVPELRKRIFFTLGMLAVYRLGAHVTAPGINKAQLEKVWGEVAGTLLGVLDLFSGGNFRTISVFALGITPPILIFRGKLVSCPRNVWLPTRRLA